MPTLLQRLLSEAKNRGVFLKVNIEQGEIIQKKTLSNLLDKAQDTAFGKQHKFNEIIESNTLLSDYQECARMGFIKYFAGSFRSNCIYAAVYFAACRHTQHRNMCR